MQKLRRKLLHMKAQYISMFSCYAAWVIPVHCSNMVGQLLYLVDITTKVVRDKSGIHSVTLLRQSLCRSLYTTDCTLLMVFSLSWHMLVLSQRLWLIYTDNFHNDCCVAKKGTNTFCRVESSKVTTVKWRMCIVYGNAANVQYKRNRYQVCLVRI